MSIEVACSCGARFVAIAELAGRTVTCPTCGGAIHVPALTPLESLDPLGDQYSDPLAAPIATPPSSSSGDPRAWRSEKPRGQRSYTGIIASASLLVFALAIVLVVWVVISIGPAKYGTPDEAFEAYRAAANSRNWKKFFATLTPDSQDLMVNMMALSLSMESSFRNKPNAELEAIRKRHGIEPAKMATPAFGVNMGQMLSEIQKQSNDAGSNIKNKRAFFLDMMAYIQKKERELQGDRKLADTSNLMANAQLTNVVIEGNTARGEQTRSFAGRTIRTPISFRKIEDGWLVEMAFNNPAVTP